MKRYIYKQIRLLVSRIALTYNKIYQGHNRTQKVNEVFKNINFHVDFPERKTRLKY